ncbi:FIST signal transduction protein [Magnetofaba australis]|nr:FIST N-terminal domain-containing protein [Magnetofaba australis]
MAIDPQIAFVFGDVTMLEAGGFHAALRAAAPSVKLIGCSTAGEIDGRDVSDGSCVVTAVRFASVSVALCADAIADIGDSEAAGKRVGEMLPTEGLKAVLIYAPGVEVNGSALIQGVSTALGGGIPLSGGLAGDGGQFTRTLTVCDEALDPRGVALLGLYGDALQFSHGSYGGWSPFGPERRVTRSEGNILYELDGEPALNIYKSYLGEYAEQLPASGLLFPFEMTGKGGEQGLIRTILSVDEASGSLVLAGDVVQDGMLRLMHANVDGLLDGAEEAARLTMKGAQADSGGLAILVSCVGRKLVMGDQVDEEVESVLDALPDGAVATGFYSYGEINPFSDLMDCKLHNQTMTIAYLNEG